MTPSNQSHFGGGGRRVRNNFGKTHQHQNPPKSAPLPRKSYSPIKKQQISRHRSRDNLDRFVFFPGDDQDVNGGNFYPELEAIVSRIEEEERRYVRDSNIMVINKGIADKKMYNECVNGTSSRQIR